MQRFKAIEGIQAEGSLLFMSPALFQKHIPHIICDTLLQKSEYLDEKFRTFDPDVSPGMLADFLSYRFVDEWVRKRFPPKVPVSDKSAPVAGGEAPVPPTYPIRVKFEDLKKALEVAQQFRLPAVIVHGDDENAETYFKYQSAEIVDCKAAIGEVSVRKTKSKDEWREEVFGIVKKAIVGFMPGKVLPKPLWFRMSNSAWPLGEYTGDGGIPPELFTPDFTPELAKGYGILTDDEVQYLEVNDHWKNVQVWITSSFSMDLAMEHLPRAIPNFDKLAIIETYRE